MECLPDADRVIPIRTTELVLSVSICVHPWFLLQEARSGPPSSPTMTNNDILKKLRVALKLRDTDIVKILQLVDFKVTETELSALFRNEDHPNYKPAGDQILRNFLNGLIIHLRGPMEKKAPAPGAPPKVGPQATQRPGGFPTKGPKR